MQPTITDDRNIDLKRYETDSKLDRAKHTAYVGAIVLAGWMVAMLLRSAFPSSGISIAPSIGGPSFGAWLCGMWATIHVYRLLDARQTQRTLRDWLRVGALVCGAAMLWAIVYSGQVLDAFANAETPNSTPALSWEGPT
jgi:hypothetical protein